MSRAGRPPDQVPAASGQPRQDGDNPSEWRSRKLTSCVRSSPHAVHTTYAHTHNTRTHTHTHAHTTHACARALTLMYVHTPTTHMHRHTHPHPHMHRHTHTCTHTQVRTNTRTHTIAIIHCVVQLKQCTSNAQRALQKTGVNFCRPCWSWDWGQAQITRSPGQWLLAATIASDHHTASAFSPRKPFFLPTQIADRLHRLHSAAHQARCVAIMLQKNITKLFIQTTRHSSSYKQLWQKVT